MATTCLVKEPFNSRTFRSSNDVFFRKQDRQLLFKSKKDAWERHRGTWGRAIYEQPIKGATYHDRCDQRNFLYTSKLPPCSLKGGRHYGAAAEPITLLEGHVDTAQKGASLEFKRIVEEEVMGNPLYRISTDKVKSSTAMKQRRLNHSWNELGAIMQLHTQACLEYATSLQVNTGKSTMESDYVKHKTASVYQPLPTGGLNSHHIKTPFAKETKKQQEKYSTLIKNYYKELYSKTPPPKELPSKPLRATSRACCRSTTPPSDHKVGEPTMRSRSAMLRSVSEATSTSEVSCSLAMLPGKLKEISRIRGEKLTANGSDIIANRYMNDKRLDLPIKANVPPVQYFLSDTRSTQTDSGIVDGLNPLWPPANKNDNQEKIGYPHLRLPLAINTLGLIDPEERQSSLSEKSTSTEEDEIHVNPTGEPHAPTSEQSPFPEEKLPRIRAQPHAQSGCVKSRAHDAYNKQHAADWVPRILDYNYLLFHLNRRGHNPNSATVMSCHASLHMDGLIG